MSDPSNMEKAAAIESDPESQALIAQQQADFAASQAGYTGEAPPKDPDDVSDDDLLAVGIALVTTMTSPGGPWHSLPPDAATDPNHPDWEENQRWAAVQGSFFACTFDGTGTIGDHAENVRGYGIPTADGQVYVRSLPQDQDARVAALVKAGNQIAYQGINVNYTLA